MGKKIQEWIEAKKKLIKIYDSKEIKRCENCGSKWGLSFHHRPKRSTGNAKHDFEHTRLVCIKCHYWFEHHGEDDAEFFSKPRGYKKKDKIRVSKKKKSKKSDWEKRHKCKNCGGYTSFFICDKCNKKSV